MSDENQNVTELLTPLLISFFVQQRKKVGICGEKWWKSCIFAPKMRKDGIYR